MVHGIAMHQTYLATKQQQQLDLYCDLISNIFAVNKSGQHII